jgi:dienelactone hydrolase
MFSLSMLDSVPAGRRAHHWESSLGDDPDSRHHERMVRRLSLLLVAVVVAGCGGSAHERSPTTTNAAPSAAAKLPEPVQDCPDPGTGWRTLTFHAHGSSIDAAVLGDGDVGVVFANDSGNSACGWTSFARELVGHGMRVLLFEYDDKSQAPGEALAAGRALRDTGTKRLALVGASIGGRAVVQATSRNHTEFAAAVSLSAERSVGANLREILPLARHVRTPSLYVGSRDDGYTFFGRDTRQLHAATPARVNRMLLVGGGDHGVDLLSDDNGPRVRATILAFLQANAR